MLVTCVVAKPCQRSECRHDNSQLPVFPLSAIKLIHAPLDLAERLRRSFYGAELETIGGHILLHIAEDDLGSRTCPVGISLPRPKLERLLPPGEKQA